MSELDLLWNSLGLTGGDESKITQGEALERSNVEFNMLEDYINNPERQVTEAEKLGACVPAVFVVPDRAQPYKGLCVPLLACILLL